MQGRPALISVTRRIKIPSVIESVLSLLCVTTIEITRADDEDDDEDERVNGNGGLG